MLSAWRFDPAHPPTLATIEKRIKAAGIPLAQLLAAARVHRDTWHSAKRERREPGAPVRRRLALAIVAHGGDRSVTRDTAGAMIALAFRAFFRAACLRLTVDEAQAYAQLQRRGEYPGDAAWKRASYVRAVALYLTNTALGVRQRELVRLTGLTPAATSLAISKIGDALGGSFEATLDAIERDVMGG